MVLNRDDRRVLRALFGHRVRFDEAERRLYRSDLWRAPAGVRRFVRSMPDAVVIPESESDLVELVRFAKEVGIALVPRGGGTAMNGGSMPVKGGIVVDFAHMDERFEPVAGGEEVHVGAGMTFASLKARLARWGRAPLVEPVFPEATTVGGWLATGGPGFGSNQHGFIEQTVKAVRIVLPDGTRRVFAGGEMDVVANLCGSTGFISAVTLLTRARQDEVPVLASFDSLDGVSKAFDAVRGAVRWWTLTLETPVAAALKAEALGSRPPARNAFLILGRVAKDEYTGARKEVVEQAVKDAGGKVVDAKKTTAWWDVHKEVYRAKSLGPSMVSNAMVVPTRSLMRAVHEVHKAVHAQHWLMTGIVAGDESLLVGYALDDERRPPQEMSYGAALAMKHAVDRLGGRVVSLGVRAADQAHRVLTPARLRRVQEFKQAVDPKGLMNPGKVFATPIVRYKPSWAPGPSVQQALRPGEPVLRRLHGSSYVRYQRREEARGAYKAGLSAALGAAGGGAFGAQWAWEVIASDMDAGLRHASASARTFGTLASSPLGWLAWIKEYLYDREAPAFTEYQYRMLAGEGIAAEAELKSRFSLPFSDLLMDLKAQLLQQGYRPLGVHRQIAEDCKTHHNTLGRPNEERAAWAEGLDLAEKGKMLVFVDDAVSFKAGDFAREAVRLLKEAGEEVAYLGAQERSSGQILFASGQFDEARSLVEHNAKRIKESGAKTVVTLDPWTHHVFKRVVPRLAAEWGVEWDVEVKHVYEVLAKHAKADKVSAPEERVAMALHHPPVFTLHGIDEETVAAALRLFGIEAVPLVHHGEQAVDVGASGAVDEVYPEIAKLACTRLLKEAMAVDTHYLVSSDPSSGWLLVETCEGLEDAEPGEVPKVHVLGAALPRAEPSGEAGEEGAGSQGGEENGDAQKSGEQAAPQAA